MSPKLKNKNRRKNTDNEEKVFYTKDQYINIIQAKYQQDSIMSSRLDQIIELLNSQIYLIRAQINICNDKVLILDILNNLYINQQLIATGIDFIFKQNHKCYAIKGKIMYAIDPENKYECNEVTKFNSRVLFIQQTKNRVFIITKSNQVFYMLEQDQIFDYKSIQCCPLIVPLKYKSSEDNLFLINQEFMLQDLNYLQKISSNIQVEQFLDSKIYDKGDCYIYQYDLHDYLSEFTFNDEQARRFKQLLIQQINDIKNTYQGYEDAFYQLLAMLREILSNRKQFSAHLLAYVFTQVFKEDFIYLIELVQKSDQDNQIKLEEFINICLWYNTGLYLLSK